MDTLKVADALIRGGFTEQQARALVDVLVEIVGELVTKREFEAGMEQLRNDLDHKIELLKRDLTIRMGGMLIVVVGVLATLQKVL